MSQPALNDIFEKLETKLEEKIKSLRNVVKNSAPLKDGSWTSKIVEKIRVSDLASENGIDCCPNHKNDYQIVFDDSRGWFICVKAKYEGNCDFKGNIVDFQKFCMERTW